MSALGSLRENISAGMKARGFRYSGYGGGAYGSDNFSPFGWFNRRLPSSQYDYRREAGLVWENSIVWACMSWIWRTFPQAPPAVYRMGKDRKLEIVQDHAFSTLMQRPNQHLKRASIWSGILLSYYADGNAYCFKQRSRAGLVAGLEYIPHWMITPRWPKDGSKFISHYEYRVDGKIVNYSIDDILHIRCGIDPTNPRRGLSPLVANLRHICTDNEAAEYAASILRNTGIPGVIVSPKAAKDGGVEEMTTDQREKFKAFWKETFTGSGRGLPFVQSIPIELASPAFNPQQMLVDTATDLPEERICSAFGIHPAVAALGSGLDRSTYNNSVEAERWSWQNSLIPCQDNIAEDLTDQVLMECMGQQGEVVGFDRTGIEALQPDQKELHERLDNSYVSGWLKRSEARIEAGYSSTPEDDVYSDEAKAKLQQESEPQRANTDTDRPPADQGS